MRPWRPPEIDRRSLIVLRAAFRLTLDALLPPQCLICEQPVGETGQFCAACFAATSFITAPFCDCCAAPASFRSRLADTGDGRLVCVRCLAEPPPWRQARAVLRYDEQARRLLLPFKHADRVDLARPLGRLMARSGARLLARADRVVPVPLHRRRLRARKYNQAALLARALARAGGKSAVLDGLVRVRRTPSLGHLGREARAEAVAGAFAVAARRRSLLVGARVLLVDDVLTSGATAAACTCALLATGCVAVDVLVAARVADPELT